MHRKLESEFSGATKFFGMAILQGQTRSHLLLREIRPA
jgi:hypothetical protein